LMSDYEKKRLVDKYREHLERAQGGIFTKVTRERLLGLARPYGGGATLSNFWNRTTTYVENALVDLDLFIQTADNSRVNKVITARSLTYFIQDLLWAGAYNNKNRAEIAQLFVQEGFRYLESSSLSNLTEIHRRSIYEAIDLGQYLAQEIARRDME